MENKNSRDYGQQFMSEVEHALESGDFDGLNHLVTATVGTVVSETAEQVAKAMGQAKVSSGNEWQQSRQRSWQQSGQEVWRQSGQSAQQGVWRQSGAGAQRGTWQQSGARNSRPAARNRTNAQPGTSNRPMNRPQSWNPQSAQQRNARTQNWNPPANRNVRRPQAVWDPSVYRKTGSVSATLFQVFGGLGVGLAGVASFVFFILYSFWSASPLLDIGIICLLTAVGSGIMLGSGNQIKSRLRRAERYMELCRKMGYVNISRIAEQMSQKERFITKELRYLIANGTFPQGHLDKDQKCFMLTNAAYEQYQELDKMREQAAREEQDAKAARQKEEEGLTQEQKELRAMLAEGLDYIRQIREKNDAIPGEVISQKLDRMESLLREIFKNLEQMPEQMPKMHRLMHYYLPTVLKLVTAYEQFDKMSVQGEDVVKAKQEIENTLDTINDAFGELLNKLFSDTAMDVTTDAQVLKTMLAKEGLVEGGMENGSES